MTNLVHELQEETLRASISTPDLLRKALTVATKLGITEFETWVSNELNGYRDSQDIPSYRDIEGRVVAWNPFHGWQPILFSSPEQQEAFSRRKCNQSIAEIESLTKAHSGKTTPELQMLFPPRMEMDLRESIGSEVRVSSIVSPSALIRIIDTVRTIVLNWSLKLEKDGILGKGLSFSTEEKKVAQNASYNINNFYGTVQNPQIQQQTSDSAQVAVEVQTDMEAIDAVIKSLEDQIAELQLSNDALSELKAELQTVRAQISSPKPKQKIIKESLSSIRKILEGAAGTIAAQLLLRLGSLS